MSKPTSASIIIPEVRNKHRSDLCKSLQNTRRVKPLISIGLALFSGGLLVLSFPNYNLYPLAWIAFVPLFFAIEGHQPTHAFVISWLSGLVYFGGTLSWLSFTLKEYGAFSAFTSFVIFFLLIAYLSLYVGFFCALIQKYTYRKSPLLLFTPALWIVLEWAKGHFLSGFPWASLAYSQTPFLPIIQIADFGSIYAVGFVIMLVNRGIYLGIRPFFESRTRARRISWKPLGIVCIPFLLSLGYGLFRLSEPIEDAQTFRVSVIQGNIAQDQKWDHAFLDKTVQTYEDLSLIALNNETPPALILWPETALPWVFGTESRHETNLHRFVDEKKVHLILGAPSIKREISGKLELRNSAFHFSPQKTDVKQYDKRHLVPFGEYVPFANRLSFIRKWVEGAGDFYPGTMATVFDLATLRVGSVICFEVIFPEVVRQFVQNGAVLMTNLTNDAWFGDSAAPYQHFSMIQFRAIENRVPFARAANTGISGFIDAQGRILQQTALFVETTATETLSSRTQESLYTQWGDFFPALCGMIALIILIKIFIKGRKPHAL